MEYKRINVTKSFLPPIEEYTERISLMWENHYVSNYGPLNNELVDKLKKYLNIENIHYTNNGTVSIQLCLEALDKDGGEVITTPFTFIATASSIVWQKYKPVFVDIKKGEFNIDPDLIEKAITKNTVAILAVHCFGYPCDIDRIEKISKKHNIPVIYDAAHCFGVKIGDRSLLSYGDMVACSLHGTKVMHTIEGGLCIANNDKYQKRLNATKNFGTEDGTYKYIGINAKDSEFHAAMGLCVFDHLDYIFSKRKEVSKWYDERLKDLVKLPTKPKDLTYNYSYYPVVFESEEQLLKVFDALNEVNVFPRRYFYPSLSELEIFKGCGDTPISCELSKKIACLPLDTYLEKEDVEFICKIIKENI